MESTDLVFTSQKLSCSGREFGLHSDERFEQFGVYRMPRVFIGRLKWLRIQVGDKEPRGPTARTSHIVYQALLIAYQGHSGRGLA